MQKETLINKKISIWQRFLRDFCFICSFTSLVVWISLVSNAAALPENTPIILKLADAELTLQIPQDLVPLNPPIPSVRLFAKSQGLSPYPSLNLIEQPGVLTSDRAKLVADTLSSYRGVGLTDARIVSNDQQLCDTRRCEMLDIDYSLRGSILRSAVALVDCGSSTALFTLTAPVDQAESLSDLRAQLVRSIRLNVRSTVLVNEPRQIIWGELWVGAALIILAVTVWRFRLGHK